MPRPPRARTGRRRRNTPGRSGTRTGSARSVAPRCSTGYAEEAFLTGRYEDSVDARRQALALYRELGDELHVGETFARLTNAYTRLGRNREAEEASREAIEVLESLPPGRELAWAYAVQAYARMLSRDNAEGVLWGTKAVDDGGRRRRP